MVKLFASALYTATVLLTAVHACVWESSGDVVGNLTLYCADVATGARLEPTSTTAPMVSVDARDALQVYVRADATQETLNADASDWTTAYNATVVAPASGGYSVVLVCGKPDGGACHVSYGLQWASPVPIRNISGSTNNTGAASIAKSNMLYTKYTGCSFTGIYITNNAYIFVCDSVQPGVFTPTVSSASDSFRVAILDATNYDNYMSGDYADCANTGCSTIYNAQSYTTNVNITDTGTYAVVVECRNANTICGFSIDIDFNARAAPTSGGASSTCPVPGTYMSTDMRLELSSSGTFAQTNDGGNGVTCATTGTYEVSGQTASFTVATVSAECRSLFTPGQKHSGPFSFSSSCQQLTLGYATTMWTLQRVATSPPPTTPSGASSTCPVPGTYMSTDMRLELSSSGTFAQTNDGGNGVTCVTTGAYEFSGQKASFTVSTVSAECRSRYTINQKYLVPFSFSSSCQQLTLIDATKTWTLQRVSSAPMASVTMLLAVLLAWCAL